MIIRKTTPEDNRALLELARQAPMDAKLVVNIDCSPDYFRLAGLYPDIPFLNIFVDLQGQFTNCPIIYQLKYILNYTEIFFKYINELSWINQWCYNEHNQLNSTTPPLK